MVELCAATKVACLKTRCENSAWCLSEFFSCILLHNIYRMLPLCLLLTELFNSEEQLDWKLNVLLLFTRDDYRATPRKKTTSEHWWLSRRNFCIYFFLNCDQFVYGGLVIVFVQSVTWMCQWCANSAYSFIMTTVQRWQWVLVNVLMYNLFRWNSDISTKTELAVLTIRLSNPASELSAMIFQWWRKGREIPNLKQSSTWSIQTGLLVFCSAVYSLLILCYLISTVVIRIKHNTPTG